ncbi:hypothetical protein WME75_11705 [Sorangium sp. So ce1014]|uniref:hypothetical protein n=1 Tax=Sorangium sp. So ce1014 TaxID=3133326 RepID=UPI003F62D04C
MSDRGTGIFLETEFFPIDDQGWGNEEREHNDGFTYDLHTTFESMNGDHLVHEVPLVHELRSDRDPLAPGPRATNTTPDRA